MILLTTIWYTTGYIAKWLWILGRPLHGNVIRLPIAIDKWIISLINSTYIVFDTVKSSQKFGQTSCWQQHLRSSICRPMAKICCRDTSRQKHIDCLQHLTISICFLAFSIHCQCIATAVHYPQCLMRQLLAENILSKDLKVTKKNYSCLTLEESFESDCDSAEVVACNT